MPNNITPIPEAANQDHLDFLDFLRESASVNMFGAAATLLEAFPDLENINTAREVLKLWMARFDSDGTKMPEKEQEL